MLKRTQGVHFPAMPSDEAEFGIAPLEVCRDFQPIAG
jgi:hypothetical protein